MKKIKTGVLCVLITMTLIANGVPTFLLPYDYQETRPLIVNPLDDLSPIMLDN